MKPTRKSLTNKLDKLFREVIYIRDRGVCRKCGSGQNLQCAHIYSRRFRNTRWCPDNALLLCAKCHFWAHDRPLDFSDFVGKFMDVEALREKSNILFKTSVSNLQELYNELFVLKEDMEREWKRPNWEGQRIP